MYSSVYSVCKMTAPIRQANKEYRSREHLTPDEVRRLVEVAELRGRHPRRDQALVLMMFRHGLRCTEAANLKWESVNLERGTVWVSRAKRGEASSHPLQADEIESLQDIKAKYPNSAYVFPNERGGQLSESAIAKIIEACGDLAELPFGVHPHMLRHSCGYWLAEQGRPTRDIQAYLGHVNIQHTVRYTAANSERFKSFSWDWD